MAFIPSISGHDLSAYVATQLNNSFPDNNKVASNAIRPCVEIATERIAFCFSHIGTKYYHHNGNTYFNHLNGDHYASFLYFLSNTIFTEKGDEALSSKVFLLNKALHGIDAFYSIKLPDIFLFVHPTGTILGNAEYGNYFIVYQNCTVGATAAGIYPKFGEGVTLYSKSSVIGNCKTGNNVIFGANSFIINTDIPDDHSTVGIFPHHKIAPNKTNLTDKIFIKK
jgi:serine O-acetyltransferase